MALTKINKCCCCIPLKSGVVIITLLWLIHGVYATVSSAIYISVYKRYIAETILYGLVTLGAAFGLYVLTFANTSKMLRKYSIIAFFIAAVEIVNNIAAIIIIALYKPAFSLKKCAYHYGYSGGCNILIVAAVISILLSAYFSIVVLAYAKRRQSKEDAIVTDDHPYGQTREDMTSVP